MSTQPNTIQTYGVASALNWALAENNIENRFHIVSRYGNRGGVESVGFIFLHPDQYEIFEDRNKSILSLSLEKNITTRTILNSWLTHFQELGLLDHLDDEQITHFKTTLNPPKLHEPLRLFYEIPDLSFSFDAECLDNLSQDLQRLLGNIFAFVDDSLQINNFSAERQAANDAIDYEHILLKFQFQGKDYQVVLRYMTDWVEVGNLMRAINRILREHNFPRQLINIDTQSQTEALVYLTEEQFARLQESPILKCHHFS